MSRPSTPAERALRKVELACAELADTGPVPVRMQDARRVLEETVAQEAANREASAPAELDGGPGLDALERLASCEERLDALERLAEIAKRANDPASWIGKVAESDRFAADLIGAPAPAPAPVKIASPLAAIPAPAEDQAAALERHDQANKATADQLEAAIVRLELEQLAEAIRETGLEARDPGTFDGRPAERLEVRRGSYLVATVYPGSGPAAPDVSGLREELNDAREVRDLAEARLVRLEIAAERVLGNVDPWELSSATRGGAWAELRRALRGDG